MVLGGVVTGMDEKPTAPIFHVSDLLADHRKDSAT
jgi:hypothetical protein